MLLRLRMPVHEKTALAFLQQKVRAVFIGKIIFELLYDASSSHSDRISVSYIENNSIESCLLYTSLELMRTPICCAVAKNHRLAGAKSLTIDVYKRQTPEVGLGGITL